MEMVSRQTGQVEDIPDHLASQAFQSGQYGFKQGAAIPVVNQGGTVGTISADKAQEAFSRGVRVAAPEEFHRAEVENKYGDVAGGLGAFGTGALNSLALGAGDALLVKGAGALGGDAAAEKTRKYIEGTREAHPVAGTLGEVAGFAAPLLLSGGAAAGAEGAEGAGVLSSLARAATAPGRAVAAIGEAGGELAGKLVATEGMGLAGRVLNKAAQLGAQGMLEGSVYGAGNAASEAALGNVDLTAEKLIAGATHGAIMGGAGGAILGGSSVLAEAAAQKVADKLAPILKRATSDDSLSEWLGTKAEESAAKATGFLKRDVDRLGPDRIQRMGRTMLDDLPEVSGKPFWRMSQEDILQTSNVAKKSVGNKLDQLYARADETAATNPAMHWPSGTNIMQRAQKELVEPMLANPGLRNIGEQLQTRLQPFVDTFEGKELGFRQTWDAIRGLDETINYEKIARSPLEGRLRQFRGMLQDEIKRAGEEVSGGFTSELEQLNGKYADFAEVSKITKKAISRADANRFISPSDYGMGFLGATLHGGISPASLALGFASGAVNHFLRKEGRQILAEGLDRASTLTRIQEATQKIDEKVSGAVDGFLSRTDAKSGEAPPAYMKVAKASGKKAYDRGIQETFDRKAEEVREFSKNPAYAQSKIQESLGGIGNHAPNIAAAVSVKATQAAAYLESKLPPGGAPGGLQPHLEKSATSQADMLSWFRYYAAVHDPTTVLDDLEHHRVSFEGADALRQNSPELYQQVRQDMIEKVSKMDRKLSYAQKIQLGLMFDFPADESLEPQYKAAIQAVYPPAQPANAGQAGGKKGGAAPHVHNVQPKLLTQIATGSQKAMMR